MEIERSIAEVIASNAGDQRFRLWAPLSDRNNKNPSSDLLALLQTQVLSLSAYRYPMEKLQKLHELFVCMRDYVEK